MSDTVLASASRILWRTLKANNVDPEAVFIEAGLDPTKGYEPKVRFPVERMRKAWEIAAQKVDDACFGVTAGSHCLPGDLYGLGFVFFTSSTLTQALSRVERYNEAVDRVISFKLSETARSVCVSYNNSRSDLPDIACLEVARWSVLLSLCRRAKEETFCPTLVELEQKSPECCEAYQQYFGCEVRFGCAHSTMHFSRQDAEEHLPAENRDLVELNEKGLLAYIQSLHTDELSRQVADIMSELILSGSFSKQQVADRLFISTRTLQRKLAAEKTSYTDILETVQKKYAQEYLRNPDLSLSEVSFLLGFSEQSALSRACKIWFGQTPTQIRKSL